VEPSLERTHLSPVLAVPLPNSSISSRLRGVECRSMRPTWLRSIVKLDWPGTAEVSRLCTRENMRSVIPIIARVAGTKQPTCTKNKLRYYLTSLFGDAWIVTHQIFSVFSSSLLSHQYILAPVPSTQYNRRTLGTQICHCSLAP
jgi:hypothetical protein